MAFDAPTTLLLTLGVALVAAGFLALEYRARREAGVLAWVAGFATVALGCGMAQLRVQSFLLGIWVADGLLVISHCFFLLGTARFAGWRMTPLWFVFVVPWLLLPALVAGADVTRAYATTNAALVALPTLLAAMLLLRRQRGDILAAGRGLGFVLLFHGGFYALKTVLALSRNAVIDLSAYQGYLIHVSLFEGMMVEVLLALLMAAAVRQRSEAKVAALADYDPLTGIFNRRAFEVRAAQALQRASLHRLPCTLMLLDLDHFKRINDTFGHGIGDRLLVTFGRRVTALLPAGGVFARIGGEEFAILLEGTSAEATRALATGICLDFAAEGAVFEGRPMAATVSIGGVALHVGATDLSAALDAADAALYEAKRQGRNQVCLQWLPTPWGAEAGDPPRDAASGREACVRSDAPVYHTA